MPYYANNLHAFKSPVVRNPSIYRYVAESVVDDNTITVDTIKSYLRIPLTVTDDDGYLLSLRDTAITLFESATNVVVLLTNWLTYRNSFNGKTFFMLTKTPYKSFDSITYRNTDGDIKTISPDNYYVVDQSPFSRVALKCNKTWEEVNVACELQSVMIRFSAGLSDTSGVYPEDVKQALLSIIAMMYDNRGDCQTTTYGTTNLPAIANAVISKYRVITFSPVGYEEDEYGLC